MAQMTVKGLYDELRRVVEAGHGDKKIVIADDNEGNGYHGMFCGVLDNPQEVEMAIHVNSGLYDSEETDPNKIVVIG